MVGFFHLLTLWDSWQKQKYTLQSYTCLVLVLSLLRKQVGSVDTCKNRLYGSQKRNENTQITGLSRSYS